MKNSQPSTDYILIAAGIITLLSPVTGILWNVVVFVGTSYILNDLFTR